MSTSSGHSVEIGGRGLRIPSGWSIIQKREVTLCGANGLRQRVALLGGSLGHSPSTTPINGLRTPFNGAIFSGHLEEGTIPPPLLERLLFDRKAHYRFEWLLQCEEYQLLVVYLAELEEDRPSIKSRIEELLTNIELETESASPGPAAP